jgi:hypothetical protein
MVSKSRAIAKYFRRKIAAIARGMIVNAAR